MKKYIRLAFRIIVSECSVEEQQSILLDVRNNIAPIGNFYDYDIAPYPKFSNSNILSIEFDVPLPFLDNIERFVGVIGGAEWHISDVGIGQEQDAIWVLNDDRFSSLNKKISWIQIQLIPYQSLPESRKRHPVRLQKPVKDSR